MPTFFYSGDDVDSIEKSADPVVHPKSDKDLVIITEEHVDEFVVSANETQTGELFIEIESAKENDETSFANQDAFEMDPIFNEIIEPSLRINKGIKMFKPKNDFVIL